jgi:type IX secretion system PorP/SprF family membrane protein
MKSNKMRKIIFTLLLCAVCFISNAQIFQVPGQYFVSPYTINPAYSGLEGYTYLQAMHRQQWLAIENAPALSNFALQLPISRKFNMGANMFYDQNGLINTTSAMISGNYLIPFNPSRRLSIGLAGGFFNTQYDISNSSNPDDPAIENFNTAYNPLLSFGVAYYSPKFHIGVALPTLLGNTLINPEISDKPYEVFYDQMVFSIGYKLQSANGAISFEPSAVYKMDVEFDDYIEFSGVLNFSESVYAGGSYRLDYGPSLLFGFDLGSFRFGYAYAFAAEQADQFGQGSHEFLVGVRIGKKKSYAVKEPKVIPTPVPKIEEKKPVVKVEVVEEPIVEEKPIEDTVKIERPKRIIKKEPQQVEKPKEEPVPTIKTYYVIIGAFNDLSNAQDYIVEMKARGFDEVNQIYNPNSRLTYVYILQTKDIDNARAMRMVMRQSEGFDETWIYIEEEEVKD